MFLKTDEESGGSRMIGIGLCPSVGIAGYILGGGHNPYSGITGLTCESAVSFDYVLADGSSTTATRSANGELFWASCGGGGGAFGILTGVTLNTDPADIFNRNVYFRYKWPISVAGSALHDFVDYDNENGKMWVRLEVDLQDGLVSYGVCWDSTSVADCEGRLGQTTFFNIPGRETVIAEEASNIVEFQKFIGPAGGYGRSVPTVGDSEAFIGTQYEEAGVGLKRLYTSGFYKFTDSKPSAAVFQKVADILDSTDRSKVAFLLVQFNPWVGANTASAGKYAFPHRDQDAFAEYIGGNDGAQGAVAIEEAQAELSRVHEGMLGALSEWKSAVYSNYPEFRLGDDEYSYLYYGANLQRLATLRGALDPTGLFDSKQPLGIGTLECPGSLLVSGDGGSRSVVIEGYPYGQLPGMRTEFTASDGCEVNGGAGAQLTSAGGGRYEAEVDGAGAFSVTVSGDACELFVETINGIACSCHGGGGGGGGYGGF